MIDSLRERHPAWRLLRADNAPLVLSFLGRYFVSENHGATGAEQLIDALDDELYAHHSPDGNARFPRRPQDYLDEWAERGWLRRFYPAGSDDVHYDAMPALERAYAWVHDLQARSFVGTESRLHTVLELLRQIAHGTESDPEARLGELQRRRDEIDREIASVTSGEIPMLDATALRDRYQQVSSTARALLSDFREVEENFRGLDRTARELIASWDGSKGDLLSELVHGRADISESDQGKSFQAFYDFLLSESRQDELAELLTKIDLLDELESEDRLRTIHHDWSDAAERTQQTVRRISEQLRRFLDDQVWLENRRVLELVKQVESAALALRATPPQIGLQVDEPGVSISLPFERPLYDARPAVNVRSLLDPVADADVDVSVLFEQTFVDHVRLATNVRSVVPPRSAALLTDIVTMFPIEQGAAEIIGYLALTDDDIDVVMDDSEAIEIEYSDTEVVRRITMPKVTVHRQ